MYVRGAAIVFCLVLLILYKLNIFAPKDTSLFLANSFFMWFPYLVIGYTSGIFRDAEIKKINYLKSICFGIMLIGIIMLMYDANAYSYEVANNGANVAAFKSVGLFLTVTASCILYNIKFEHVKLSSIICDFLSIFSDILYFFQRIVIDFIMYRWNYINAGDFT